MKTTNNDKIGILIVEPHVEFITPIHFPNWAEGYKNLIEECGRTCYQSEPREGDTSDKFIRRHLKHESILEHGSFTVKFVCSRACSHQLVRHRLGSISQESQRFCSYSATRFQKQEGLQYLKVIMPPSISKGQKLEDCVVWRNTPNQLMLSYFDQTSFLSEHLDNLGVNEVDSIVIRSWCKRQIEAFDNYLFLRGQGIPAEDARFSLPGATKTELCMTFNFRMWRHILGHPVFGRALNPHAQWEIQKITREVLFYFMKHIPVLFEDLMH